MSAANRPPKLILALLLFVALVVPTPSSAKMSANSASELSTGYSASGGLARHPVTVNFRQLAMSPAAAPPARVSVPQRHIVSEAEYARLKDTVGSSSPPSIIAPATRASPGPELVVTTKSFEGIDDNGYIPSDAAIASSGTQVVYCANEEFSIENVTSGSVTGPVTFAAWFSVVGLPTGTEFFDPRVLWDSAGGRFILVVDAVNFTTMQAWMMVSYTYTSDPTAEWGIYHLDTTVDGSTPTSNYSDYPTLGIDPDAVYIGMNQYSFSTNYFQYAKVRLLNRSALESGTLPGWWDFWRLINPFDGTYAFSVQPAVTYSYSGVEYLANSNSLFGSYLTIWSLTNPLGSPSLSASTVSVPSYSLPTFAHQAGTSALVDTGDSRLQQLVQKDGYLWTTLTTYANFGPGPQAMGMFFQINPSLLWTVNAAYVGWIGTDFYYPSVAVDAQDNAVVIANCSSIISYIDICASSRSPSDPINQTEPAQYVYDGSGPYAQLDGFGNNRWGDYSAAAVDPANALTVWTLAEYPQSGNLWGTRVDELSYQAPSPTPMITLTPTVTSTRTITPTPTITPTATESPTVTPTPHRVFLPEVDQNAAG